METVLQTQALIETEQKLRASIHEILTPFHDRVKDMEKKLDAQKVYCDSLRNRQDTIQQRLESDSKMRSDLIEMEKHLLQVEKTVNLNLQSQDAINQEVFFCVKKLNEMCEESKVEELRLQQMQKKMGAEIKDFENLLSDYKASNQQSLKELRKHVEDLDFDHRQTSDSILFEVQKVNTQIRNINHVYTEISKQQRIQ